MIDNRAAVNNLQDISLEYDLDELLTEVESYVKWKTKALPWSTLKLQQADAVQEILLQLCRRIVRYDPARGTLKSFVFTLVNNELNRWLRVINGPKEQFFIQAVDYKEEFEEGKEAYTAASQEDYGYVELKMLLEEMSLTKRERQVLQGLVDGYSVGEIGEALGLTHSRVSQLRSSLIKKIQASCN